MFKIVIEFPVFILFWCFVFIYFFHLLLFLCSKCSALFALAPLPPALSRPAAQHDVRRAHRPIEHMNTAAFSWSARGNQLAVIADRVDRRPPALRFAPESAVALPLDAPEPAWVVRDARGEIDWAAVPTEAGLTPPSGPTNAPVPPDNAAKAIVLLPLQAPLFGPSRLASQVGALCCVRCGVGVRLCLFSFLWLLSSCRFFLLFLFLLLLLFIAYCFFCIV